MKVIEKGRYGRILNYDTKKIKNKKRNIGNITIL